MEFDLDRGLSLPVDGVIPPPHNITPLEENEALMEPAPAPGPPGRPPNAHQNHDLQLRAPLDPLQQLAQDLIEFQKQEIERFGRPLPARSVIEQLGSEDLVDSDESDLEDQSIDLQDPEDETNMDHDSGDDVSREYPNPRVSPESQLTQHLDQVQHQHHIEPRSIAENLLEVVGQVQIYEIQAAGAGDRSMDSLQGVSPMRAAARAQATDPGRLARSEDQLPPVEEKYTTEMSTQIVPANFSSDETVALTAVPSPSPAPLLSNALGDVDATDLTICDSNLEILPPRQGGVDGARMIPDVGASVKTEAAHADVGNAILEDDHRSINLTQPAD